MRFALAILLVAAAASAQTSGELQDQELDLIRQQLSELQALVNAYNPEHEHDHHTELQLALDSLTGRVDLLESTGVTPAECTLCTDAAISSLDMRITATQNKNTEQARQILAVDARADNLYKYYAFHYQRFLLIETTLDPEGSVSACWDSGGVPDFLALTCTCPVNSSWVPASGEEEAACRWDSGASAEPAPFGEAPEPTPGPTCEPDMIAPAPECTWDTTTCQWSCPG